MSEPLISTARRQALEADMAKFVSGNHQWAVYWFSGVLCSLIGTLPPDDPWRQLSGTVDLTMLSVDEPATSAEHRVSFTHPQGAPAPSVTGGVFPDGSRFGEPSDSDDLVSADLGTPPDADIGLVGLLEPLSDLSSGIGGLACGSPESVADSLAAIYHHLWLAEFSGTRTTSAGEEFLAAVSAVIGRFTHRRRLYTGLDDPFPSMDAFTWMSRADRLVSGSRRISAEMRGLVDAAIDPTSYRALRIH